MAVPIQRELYRPILEVADESAAGLSRKELRGELTVRFHWTEDDFGEMVPSGAQTKIDNRMNWAIYRLKSAELLDYPEQGFIQITPAGKKFLGEHTGVIRGSLLRRMRSEGDVDSAVPTAIPDDSNEVAPDEQIALSHRQHQDMLADDILDSMKSLTPSDFERLVNGLLREMGYGTVEQAQGFSGDHGVDGILNQDSLGLDKIYVQAKRWDNAPVGEPDIARFSGSLDLKGATKGVFITTSTFSAAAEAYIRNNRSNKTIRLIDGRELAALMIRHGVGVVTEITYEVKKLDANYFAEV